jgi:hypothetical protein
MAAKQPLPWLRGEPVCVLDNRELDQQLYGLIAHIQAETDPARRSRLTAEHAGVLAEIDRRRGGD